MAPLQLELITKVDASVRIFDGDRRVAPFVETIWCDFANTVQGAFGANTVEIAQSSAVVEHRPKRAKLSDIKSHVRPHSAYRQLPSRSA
jgi:hypothetical protein